MRVTTNTFFADALRNIERGYERFEDAQRRLSSGLKVERPSDDPTAVAQILQTEERSRASAQFRRTITDARARISAEETVLDSVTNLLARAKELATAEGGDSGNRQSRLAAQAEVDQLLDAVIGHANTHFKGVYLFGGVYADQQPLDAVGDPSLTQPPAGEHLAQIGESETVRTNHDGQQVFLDSGVIQALRDVSAALGANDPTAIQNSITSVDNAHAEVQLLFTEAGARSNRLDASDAHLDARQFQLTEQRADLEEADMARATIDLAHRQTALQSAMLAASRAFGLTLTEYLR